VSVYPAAAARCNAVLASSSWTLKFAPYADNNLIHQQQQPYKAWPDRIPRSSRSNDESFLKYRNYNGSASHIELIWFEKQRFEALQYRQDRQLPITHVKTQFSIYWHTIWGQRHSLRRWVTSWAQLCSKKVSAVDRIVWFTSSRKFLTRLRSPSSAFVDLLHMKLVTTVAVEKYYVYVDCKCHRCRDQATHSIQLLRHSRQTDTRLTVTGQLADCQLADWSTRGLDNSRTGQVADWTTRGLADAAKRTKTKHSKSPVASASCLVLELTSPRDVQSAIWRIRELSSNQ